MLLDIRIGGRGGILLSVVADPLEAQEAESGVKKRRAGASGQLSLQRRANSNWRGRRRREQQPNKSTGLRAGEEEKRRPYKEQTRATTTATGPCAKGQSPPPQRNETTRADRETFRTVDGLYLLSSLSTYFTIVGTSRSSSCPIPSWPVSRGPYFTLKIIFFFPPPPLQRVFHVLHAF